MTVDPRSDIDLSDTPNSVWELDIETKSKVKSLRLLNVPVNLTVLDFGVSISSSLSESFHLPMTLAFYRGPVMDGMKIPSNIEYLTIMETNKSIPSYKVELPMGIKHLAIENPKKFSKIDEIIIPDSIESFKINGKHNCSLERLRLPQTIKSVDLGRYSQPVDLIVSNFLVKNDRVESGIAVPADILEKSPLIVKSEDTLLMDSLYINMPKIDKMHVILDEKVKTLGDVWTEVLLEGRIKVRELTLVNGTGNTCLSDSRDVFHRSSVLKRKLCRRLVVLCESFSHGSTLNLAASLKSASEIDVDISYVNPPSPCIVPRLANLLGLEKNGVRYSSDKFGAITTAVEMTKDGHTKFLIGASPEMYVPPPKTVPYRLPVSSAEFEEAVIDKKPIEKSIVLHTWSSCSYCDKQEKQIEEFKNTSEKHKNEFDDLVEVKKIDNPSDIDDKRVDSFPTWVKDGDLIVGVQNQSKLGDMLGL